MSTKLLGYPVIKLPAWHVKRLVGPKPRATPGLRCAGPYGPEFSAAEAQRELGQRRRADVGFRANNGRSVDPRWMSAYSHKRTLNTPETRQSIGPD